GYPAMLTGGGRVVARGDRIDSEEMASLSIERCARSSGFSVQQAADHIKSVQMAVIGTICPNAPGHLNPLTTLCRELQRRGHRVIFYHAPPVAEKIRSRGFEVRCFGEEYPPEEHLKSQQVQATLSGYKAFRHTRDLLIRGVGVMIRQVPAMLRDDRIELMLVDQVS